MKKLLRKILFGVLMLVGIGALSGCTTEEPENTTARPWNAPQGWEHGLPSSINEGR